MKRNLVLSMAVLVAILAAVVAVAQPRSDSSPEAREQRAARAVAERLAALRPADPAGYLLLAEEVAEKRDELGARRLAIRLYVLAFELDRAQSPRPTIAASACLGLASVTGSTRDRQWLTALARSLDPRLAGASWASTPEPPSADSFAYRVATFLGEVRSGDGLAARRLLADPDVAAALERYDSVLRRAGARGGTGEIIREASRWPCHECSGERVVKNARNGAIEYTLCPRCKGEPGPRLSASELAAQLRFEAWLLQGTQRSWGSQLGVDGGAPLGDPDVSELARTFAIDTTLVLWRNDAWIADPAAPKPAPQSTAKPTAEPNASETTDGAAPAPDASVPTSPGN